MTDQLAIPSAWRPHGGRTLEGLLPLEGQVDVTYWVPSDQYAEYRRNLPGWIRVSPKGGLLHIARGRIMEEFRGDRITMMDDDIPWYIGSNRVFRPTDPRAPATPHVNIVDVMQRGWDALRVAQQMHHPAATPRAWGIYPVPYSGSMLKPRWGVGDLFLVGQTLACEVPSDGAGFEQHLMMKEDYEWTAHHLDRDGAVVRLDYVCAYSTVGTGKGGMEHQRTYEREAYAVDYLLGKWPTRFRHSKERKGLPQVALVGEAPVYYYQPHESIQRFFPADLSGDLPGHLPGHLPMRFPSRSSK